MVSRCFGSFRRFSATQRLPKTRKTAGAKYFAFFPARPHAGRMTQPLALVFYEKLMPGSQLVNRLQDLNYRVQAVNDLASFQHCAQSEGPMLVFVDLESKEGDVCLAIAALKSDAATQHIPVVAFASERAVELQAAAQKAGAKLVVSETTLLEHLPELLNQALQVE
jgi:CheY-like chemotaxis protein